MLAQSTFQGIGDGFRLLIDLFQHVVAIRAFITSIMFYVAVPGISLNRVASSIQNRHPVAGHFRYIAFFQEHESAGHREQCQLVGCDKVFANTDPNHQWAAGTGNHKTFIVVAVHHHHAIGTFQPGYRFLHGVEQGVAALEFQADQMGNNFRIGIRGKDIAFALQKRS